MSTPLLENILNQPQALRRVLDHQMSRDGEALVHVAEILRSKKRIVLTGMGASYFACVPFQYMLAAQGFDVACVETAELLYFPTHRINETDAVVLCSRSGESIEIVKLLDHLRDSNCATIAITNIAGSTLSTNASASVVVGSPPDQLVAIQTYTATVAAFILLAAAIRNDLANTVAELTQTIETLCAVIPVWVSERQQMHAFLRDARPLYLLARGPALGNAFEGMLLMHETAKAPAVAISVPQFRHGPVEVADQHLRAVIIGTLPQTLSLDVAFVNDLMHLGAQVRWIGNRIPELHCPSLCSWPSDVPVRCTSIVEPIPLQIAAYTQAELNGVAPGQFRWAPAITSSETGFLNPQ